MQQDQPQIDQQQLGEKEYNIQQSHREENLPQETENHQPEEQQPQEEHHPQQPLEGQGPQQQGEPQLPPGPFDDQNEEPEPEPEEQVQPNEEEEEADGHQVEEEQPVEQAVEEQVEEGRSSNGPPEYNPDLIDDEDEEAATHPLIPDTQQLPEQGEFYMGEELIEPEGPSEVSHVYAQQEEIEWRDQEEPISSPHHDYHFQGIHEEEAIEHQPALLSTAAQVGSSLMKLEPLPPQAVQTVEAKAKPETVEQSASTDPPPKTVPTATQASKVESQQKTDIPSKMIKQETVQPQVKPETSKAPQTSQIKQSVKSNTPKDSKPHPEQKPKETVKQSKVPSVQAPRRVQPVKKSETIKQSQVSAIKTVSKTPSEQPPLKKQAEKAIQSKKTSQGKEQIKEQTTPKKDNPSSLLLLRNQKQVQREQQAEKQKIEQQQARKNELKEHTRLAKIEKEREQLQRQRKELEKAENERRQKQRQLMQQRQKQRERAQKERKDNQERERLAKQQQQRLRQKQQQNLHAQNVSQVSKASMDREEPQQALSSLPPPTIAKKKKKKKVSKQPQNKSAALPDAPQSPPTAPASKKPPTHDNESEHDRVSVVHSDIGQEEPRPVRNMVSEILMAEGGKPNKEGMVPVVLTSLMVVREAEKQRVGTTFRMFLKYNYQYERTVTAYKRIIVNVASQLQRKKAQKRPLQRILEDYFQDFAKIAKQFNDRCYKLQVQSAGEVPSKNPLASLRLQLKKGFDEMVFLRKSVANHNNRLALYINNTLLPQLRKAFEGYYAGIVAEETKQAARRDELVRKEKQLAKVISQTQRSFQRGLQGRFKEDLFIELSKFINEQKIHRATLRNYGRGLLDLRHAYMRSEKELFDRLQEQLLRFKQEWWAAYGERRVWREAEGLGERIKEATKFADLCTLVDLDYIKYVLELQSKQERDRFGSRDFQNYLDLVFFDRVVGNIRDLLKGATNKSFPLRAQGDELIHSISGNLVVFHRPSDLCRDHFRISNLNAKVVATGTVQFDELQKGILFDDSRTVRLQLKDDDRAEELICYLNEKEEDIVLPS